MLVLTSEPVFGVFERGTGLDGYNIEGISIGGHETCVIIPELKCAFDIGRCPARAVAMNFLFITHGHLDHIGGLPMYIATRGLYSMTPPTVFVPPSIKEDVENLIEVHRKMGQVELNVDLVALDIGETYELRNDLVVRPFKTHHVIPSQ
ncbi:tRNase Z TRZ2, chloroplastic, partial [Tanacetum coccineum]